MTMLQLVNAFDGSLINICSGSGRPDWLGRPVAHGYPPAVCGSGAAVAEVHPPEWCCWKRPFSSHIRSRRPWSDFLRSSLTFRLELWLLAVGCEAVRRGSPSRGLKIQTARLDLASLCAFTGSLKTNVPNRQCDCSLLNREGRCRDALFPGARLNGDVNAPLMRFPEPPQDQCLLRWQSEIWELQVK